MPNMPNGGRLDELKDRLLAELTEVKQGLLRLDDRMSKLKEESSKNHYDQEHAILSLKLKVALIGAGSGLSVAGLVEIITKLVGS